MVISRSLLFLLFQVLLALVLFLTGILHAWDESARWWVLTIIPANLGRDSFSQPAVQGRRQRGYLDILRFSEDSFGRGHPVAIGQPRNRPAARHPSNQQPGHPDLRESRNRYRHVIPITSGMGPGSGSALPVHNRFRGTADLFRLRYAPALQCSAEERLDHLAYRSVLPGSPTLFPALDPGWTFHALALRHVPAICPIRRVGD